MSRTFLQGISLGNFRAIGAPVTRIAPFREINFFIGPNNSGKSTVLHFLANYLHVFPPLMGSQAEAEVREFFNPAANWP